VLQKKIALRLKIDFKIGEVAYSDTIQVQDFPEGVN